jgi:GT2 family glycosyltransferase
MNSAVRTSGTDRPLPSAVAGEKVGTRLQIAVGIATRGRPAILAETIADLETQRRPPDSIVVAYADPADIGAAPRMFPQVRFVQTSLGLTKQRNAILQAATASDVIAFLDDDFYLHRDYLSTMERLFSTQPQVTVATGQILADGINGPGLNFAQAKEIIAQAAGETELRTREAFNAYGCNMCLRMEPIRANKLRFDENLPLYGWYEDVEFSRQLASHGSVVWVAGAAGVHLGAKSGRQSGYRLGYSQIANPLYLARKRSVSWSYAVASMTSRFLKNLVRSTVPEPYVDRRGRLRGNLRAAREVLSGAISPTRILQL